MILQADSINKNYLQTEAPLVILRDLSLGIAERETVAVMGRSGCGKSTLISILAGLMPPSSGRVVLAGCDLQGFSGRELNRFRARNLGLIFQQFHLLEHLTALENVRLPLDLNRLPDGDQRAQDMLAQVDLAERAQHFPNQLSRGECQRLAIARVLVMRPRLILADEPTGSLDQRTGREVMELIFRLAFDQNCALLLVTHDPELASRCNRRFSLLDGQLVPSTT